MLVLGVESSCDETAAAVVADGKQILANVVASQIPTHAKYGGVVPELASREHLKCIVPVVDEACRQAGISLAQIDALAVTAGPGLIGSLLVGVVYAKALALALDKPLVGVNHIEGHIHAVLLENQIVRTRTRTLEAREFPAVALVVSGGHTSLFRVERHTVTSDSDPTFTYTLLGRSRDDAAGEAFDKVAKLLALGYPGGPIIDGLARYGNLKAVDFGRIRMKGNPLDFSFSGLKTAVLYQVRGTALAAEAEARRAWRQAAGSTTPSAEDWRAHTSQATLDLVASFQDAVITDLVERTLAAADEAEAESILVAGGVACNSRLRDRFAQEARRRGLPVFFPSPTLSTDNAAMIAAAGYYRLRAGHRADTSLTANASAMLGVPAPAPAERNA